MTSGKFDPGRWSDRLALALVCLAEAHECFQDSLGEQAVHYSGQELSSGAVVMVHHYGDALLALYHGACFPREGEQDEGVVRLRSALKTALDILAEHPALAPVADSSCSARKFAAVIADKAEETDLLHILVGLMTRGRDLPTDGFRVACRELKELLGPNRAGDTVKPNAGLHVVLFHGLRFEAEVSITDDLKIVPFENVREYVDEPLLRPFTPNLAVPRPWEPVGAIVKSFQWHPAFHPSDDKICLDLDWGGSFREDGERLVELLAITHAAPVVCLVTMHYCVGRTACRLLGQPHRRACYTFGQSAHSFDRLSVSREPCATALNEAKELFRKRNGPLFRKYEPIVARLAEAVQVPVKPVIPVDHLCGLQGHLESVFQVVVGNDLERIPSLKRKYRPAVHLPGSLDLLLEPNGLPLAVLDNPEICVRPRAPVAQNALRDGDRRLRVVARILAPPEFVLRWIRHRAAPAGGLMSG